MSFLLDTDICSAYLKGDPRVFNRFMQYSGGLHVSILTLAELYAWVYIAVDPSIREAGLLNMMADVTLLPLDEVIARRCGELRASLQRSGTKVATIDLLIATTAMKHNFTLVTHNQRHFGLVPGIRLEDWLS